MSTVIKGSASGQINLNDTTGSIQLNGSDVLTIDSSGNLTAPNNITANTIIPTSSSAPTNGMFLPATNTVGVSTNSTERMRVNSSGYVGINKNPNNIAQLEVKAANSTIHQLFLEQNNTEHGWQLFADNADGGLGVFRRNNAGQTERMRIKDDGNVWINTTSSFGPARLNIGYAGNTHWGIVLRDTADIHGSAMILFQKSNGTTLGSITNNGNTAVAYNTSSDYRLKENVAPMSGSIDRLKQLKPSTWSWVQNGSHGEGFLAHEAQAVVPEAVTGTKDEVNDEGNPVYQGIDQSKLVPLLTSALQEAITKIEDLETRIQALESA